MFALLSNVVVSLLALTGSEALGRQVTSGDSFLDIPPSDYNERTTLRDCPKRFYSNVGPYGGPYGGLGGVRAYRGEFQHMVAIGWTRSDDKIDYLCGGSLITRDFVLTAAHCAVDSENIPPDTTRVGDTDLGSSEDDEFAEQIVIARFTTHPQYRGSRRYFDIALVQLQTPVKDSGAVCPACLWRGKELPLERMDAIGFGATGFAEALSPTLQRVQLDPIDLGECAQKVTVSRRQMPDGFRQDQFCAASSTMDTCEGDSGGPIGVKRLDVGGGVIQVVVGVVSFGTPCTVGSTGVYSKVSEFMDWIEQETKSSFDYRECTKATYCPGRVRKHIPVNFGGNYAQNRFGLLWDATDTSSLYQCGATLIDDQYLMTLASCVTSSKGHPTHVAYSQRERLAVADVYVSPTYVAGRPESDIALLRIAKFVNTNVFRPACLWNRHHDGEWKEAPQFSAYGPYLASREPLTLTDDSVFVGGEEGDECAPGSTTASDVVCFNNNVSMVPGVCSMDYGAPVINGSFWGEPVFAYGLVSTLSKGCGSDLFVTDVTPHIPWIESIIVGKRDQFLVFSD